MCVVHSTTEDLALETADAYQVYQRDLVSAGLLIPLGVRGVYGRGADFERVIERFDALVSREGAKLGPEVMRFPPVFSRADYEKIDHIHNFPDLLGSLHTFTGDDKDHRAMLE